MTLIPREIAWPIADVYAVSSASVLSPKYVPIPIDDIEMPNVDSLKKSGTRLGKRAANAVVPSGVARSLDGSTRGAGGGCGEERLGMNEA